MKLLISHRKLNYFLGLIISMLLLFIVTTTKYRIASWHKGQNNGDTNGIMYFTDPKTYTGPVIAGWEPNKNRDMPVYIRPNESTVINDLSCFKFEDTVRIFIIVQSAPVMFERRQANRRTWIKVGKERYSGIVKTLFLFGKTDDQHDESLILEQQKNRDLIQMDFVDNYFNVTFDTVMALKFTLNTIRSGQLQNLQFLMIADDDTYINVDALVKNLLEQNSILKPDDGIIWGTQLGGKVHFPEKHFKDGQILPKVDWSYVPKYLLSNKYYPSLVSGFAYVLPISTLDCLYEASLVLPYLHVNDAFLTGFARAICGFKIRNEPKKFKNVRIEAKKWTKDIIAIHYMNSAQKLELKRFLS